MVKNDLAIKAGPKTTRDTHLVVHCGFCEPITSSPPVDQDNKTVLHATSKTLTTPPVQTMSLTT
jgi:hypothetical protein